MAKRKRNNVLLFPHQKRRAVTRAPLADPHPEWPIHLSETSAYHNEPRNPYQSEEEDSTQAFVQKYLELADTALAKSAPALKKDPTKVA